MKKILSAMLVMAAALSAQSETTIELLANGAGTTLDGWEKADYASYFKITVDEANVSWFESSYSYCEMSQSIAISEDDVQRKPTVTASVIASATVSNWQSILYVFERDANGNNVVVHTVFRYDDETFQEDTFSVSFTLNPATRTLCYRLIGQGDNYQNGPKYRNCSLKITYPPMLTFVSEGTTNGTASVAGETAPTAPTAHWNRTGDYTFLGYYTEGGEQVYNEHGEFVQGSLSGLSSDTTLYARWAPPEGSIAKLVYRGQLTKLGLDDAASSDGRYTKTMHFRVYDDESAETPIWRADNQTVNVNKDGSFVATFGDEELAGLIATGSVTHVGVAIGASAIELKPRRALRPVAAVNRALVAEAAGKDPRIGNLVTENALAANSVTVSQLEVAGTVTAPGAGAVDVSPVVVGDRETLTLLRGDGVNVFSKNRIDLGETGNVQRGQKIGSKAAPSDGIALIASRKTGSRGLRIPGVIQYCREGDWVRAPASEPDGVKVTFFPFIGKESK